MVAIKKQLWVLLALAILLDSAVGQEYSPANPLCGCFRQNAVKTLGSTCFALGAAIFGGDGQIKKHDLLKYIVESCPGKTMPYEYDDDFSTVRGAFYSGNPGGDWSPVTGTAQVGDIIVTSADMTMVTALGTYPVILSDGIKVVKSANSALWTAIKRNASSTWKQCAAWTDVSGHIDPTSPRDQCNAFPWTEQPVPAGATPYWRGVSAITTNVRGVVPSVKSTTYRVLRYNPFDECASSPCMNGGQCNDLTKSYSCTCAAGYTGTLCETDIDECTSSPCMNGGQCNDLVNSLSCTCAAGYAGTLCETATSSSCGFESGGICGFNQDDTDVFDWTRKSGDTETVGTGPNGGHNSNWYIYIEADTRAQGDTARISTSFLSGGDTWCVGYAYHMHGNGIGTLRLYTENRSGTRTELWSESRQKGNNWLERSTSVTLTEDSKIGWEGIRGGGEKSDIAMDDLSVGLGACPSVP